MENPYHHEFPTEHLLISRRGAWTIAVLFALLLAIPPLWQDFRLLFCGKSSQISAVRFWTALQDTATGEPIAARLRNFENRLSAESLFAAPARQFAQEQMLACLGRGNARVLVGENGWLFYRPEIRALTGYGPLQPEPGSVAKDPTLADWRAALPAILQFGADLKARGVSLWLLPTPMKESIYPEMLTGHPAATPVLHPDTALFHHELEGNGIRVLDLAPLLWSLKSTDTTEGPVYLRQDTHWSPRAMESAADFVAAALGEAGFETGGAGLAASPSHVATSFGDLVEKLDLPPGAAAFAPEAVKLHRVHTADGSPVLVDRASPVVLLGDSFVNIFNDPSLGFAEGSGGQGSIAAGFAQHLALRLQRRIDVIAKNGGGASTVREEFARRPDQEIRAKKVVIWALAARDLFMGRTEARSNQVAWRMARFTSRAAAPQAENMETVVEATLLERPPSPNPKTTPYTEALFYVKYRIDRVISGSFPDKEAVVLHWLFRNRTFVPEAEIQAGRRYRLTLLPWLDQTSLQATTLIGDDFQTDTQISFSQKVEPISL